VAVDTAEAVAAVVVVDTVALVGKALSPKVRKAATTADIPVLFAALMVVVTTRSTTVAGVARAAAAATAAAIATATATTVAITVLFAARMVVVSMVVVVSTVVVSMVNTAAEAVVAANITRSIAVVAEVVAAVVKEGEILYDETMALRPQKVMEEEARLQTRLKRHLPTTMVLLPLKVMEEEEARLQTMHNMECQCLVDMAVGTAATDMAATSITSIIAAV